MIKKATIMQDAEVLKRLTIGVAVKDVAADMSLTTHQVYNVKRRLPWYKSHKIYEILQILNI